MGFETCEGLGEKVQYSQFELFPYGIWNKTCLGTEPRVEVIWTISLWDLKHFTTKIIVNLYPIWTISLWDLKHVEIQYTQKHLFRFELFPYGIWN